MNESSERRGAPGGPLEPGPADTTVHLGVYDAATGLMRGTTRSGGLSREDTQAVAALPPTSALLIVQHGPNVGARFLLDAPRTTAGRSPDSDIFLDDVTVSRKHAEFVADEGEYAVRDVGSLNGTYLNRERIDALTVLSDGDEVQIGKYRLTYHASPNRPAQSGSGRS